VGKGHPGVGPTCGGMLVARRGTGAAALLDLDRKFLLRLGFGSRDTHIWMREGVIPAGDCVDLRQEAGGLEVPRAPQDFGSGRRRREEDDELRGEGHDEVVGLRPS
jgi:hypothetical protein